MKILLLIAGAAAFVALMGLLLFGAAWFYNWAWATTSIPGGLRIVRPVAAAFGALVLMLSMALAIGPLAVIPLTGLGYLK